MQSEYIYSTFKNEEDMLEIIHLVEQDLSEPYSIYTFRYFIYAFPELTLLIHHNKKMIGLIIARVDTRGKSQRKRGYIAMLTIKKEYRKQGLAKVLVDKLLDKFKEFDVDEVSLETEIDNLAALELYKQFGFIRDKRLDGYYMNGMDAYRLKLYLN